VNLEAGKTYLVTCQRNGTFAMRVTGQCDTWANGVVVEHDWPEYEPTIAAIESRIEQQGLVAKV